MQHRAEMGYKVSKNPLCYSKEITFGGQCLTGTQYMFYTKSDLITMFHLNITDMTKFLDLPMIKMHDMLILGHIFD